MISAQALDLYTDSETKQIFSEPGHGRQRLGSFVRAEDSPAQISEQSTVQQPELATIKEELAQKSKEIESLENRIKETEKVQPKYGPGLHFESADGNFTAAIDGRFQVDSQYNITNDVLPATGTALPNELNSGANIRRARPGVAGKIYRVWDYKFEFDFSRGNGSVTSGITDTFLRWSYYDPFSLKIGSFKEPFSLEEATSNRFLTFIE